MKKLSYIDLGLPSGILWAKCNYGANNETESGGYYSWDEAMKLPIQLPTKEQLEELIEHTTSECKKDYKGSGVNGRLFTSKENGNSIFILASGYADNGVVSSKDSSGSVWYSSSYYSDPCCAWGLYFNNNYMGMHLSDRHFGRSVRAVKSN